MKTVTIEQFMAFEPCYAEEQVRELAGDKTEWTALEVLRLEQVPVNDRLWAVSREEFIPAEILHEFACRCAKKALTLVDNPDQRSIDAIAAKRAWMRGEITDEQLDAARSAAWSAADAADAADAAWYAARSAARSAADAARSAAGSAAWSAARSAADAARSAAMSAARSAADAADAARSAARSAQIVMLIELLEGTK